MKRYGSILLMALALAACSKTPVDPGTAVSGDVEEVITARMVGTRVDFDGVQGLFTWSEGDQIAVHCSAGYNASGAEVIAPKYKTPSITIDANDPAYCTFHLIQSAGQKRDAYAVYPASIVDLTSDGTSLNITLPASYEIGPEGMGTTSPTPMVAVNDPDATELYFKHVGGLLRLTLNDVSPATKVITVNLGKRLTGEFAVNDPDSAVPYIATDDAADEVSFVLSEELADYTDWLVLNVPVPTGTYSMLKVSAKNSNGETVYAYEDKTERFFDAGRGRRVETSISSLAIPLCLEAIEVGTVIVTNPLGLTIEYSRDNETWTSTSSDLYLVVNEGDCVYLRGNNAKYSRTTDILSTSEDWTGMTISSDGLCYVYGNVMSLIDAENFVDCKSFTETFALSGLFISATDLVMHPEKALELPATDLTRGCYFAMFYGTNITKAPELPARIVPKEAYVIMFANCPELLAAPDLSVDELGENACWQMFRFCEKLSYCPDLIINKIGSNALNMAFTECPSLKTAPAIVCDEIGELGLYEMFYESGLTTGSSLKARIVGGSACSSMYERCADLVDGGTVETGQSGERAFSNMFRRCTSLKQVDISKAAVSKSGFYYMFNECIALETAPELPATELVERCYEGMFNGCTSLTTAPALPATSMERRCYSQMFTDCTALETAPALPALNLAESCYSYMFQGCSSLTAAPALPATVLAETCYNSMFERCTSLVTAPELPALDLANGCYSSMFSYCSNLNYVKALFTSAPAYWSYGGWLNGVSATGTFVKNAAATWEESGIIPPDWTVETVTL